jgi:hypothetical protein
MAASLSTIFDNRSGASCRLCVLIPVRNDQRLFAMLDVLKGQVTPDVNVYVLNDLKPDPFVRKLPDPIHGVILYSHDPMTISQKVNALVARAQGEWLVIIESDTIPHRDWIAEMLTLTRTAAPRAIHQGGEIFGKRENMNNILFRRDLKVPDYDDTLYWAQDTAWFMACEKAGIPVVRHDMEAIIFHDARMPEGDMRFVAFARDFAYLTIRHGNFGFLRRRLIAESYYVLKGVASLILLPLFCVYFAVRKALGMDA